MYVPSRPVPSVVAQRPSSSLCSCFYPKHELFRNHAMTLKNPMDSIGNRIPILVRVRGDNVPSEPTKTVSILKVSRLQTADLSRGSHPTNLRTGSAPWHSYTAW
ncbi:hypothetical protein BD311DRAFT_484480 [Dichomitus squalens]|uniref:Uncharacterized protein n=1 Tax=Dichomitus squalens TaxID=114155 RepID=A0A4Q9MII1_9APHY|nr:hypothetical protein BD311DRAFT_484480 [Dichomitus squalens]